MLNALAASKPLIGGLIFSFFFTRPGNDISAPHGGKIHIRDKTRNRMLFLFEIGFINAT